MTALFCAVYDLGALYLTESIDSISSPPFAGVNVVTATVPPSNVEPVYWNTLAPFAAALLVVKYVMFTMLPLCNALPMTSLPNSSSYSWPSISLMKYTWDVALRFRISSWLTNVLNVDDVALSCTRTFSVDISTSAFGIWYVTPAAATYLNVNGVPSLISTFVNVYLLST